MIEIRRIDQSDPLYAQEIALRDSVLLKPIGLSFDRFKSVYPGVEDRLEHFVAVFDHPSGPRVIGCACLLVDQPENGVGRLMQMAVDPQRQGEGIGRKLVVAIECRALGELGLCSLFCHSQIQACGFYESLGWRYDGPEFSEAGLRHRRMVMCPPASSD